MEDFKKSALLKEKIVKSNKAVKKLEENGFLCLGQCNKMTQVAVKNSEGKLHYFKDYIQAANELLKTESHV